MAFLSATQPRPLQAAAPPTPTTAAPPSSFAATTRINTAGGAWLPTPTASPTSKSASSSGGGVAFAPLPLTALSSTLPPGAAAPAVRAPPAGQHYALSPAKRAAAAAAEKTRSSSGAKAKERASSPSKAVGGAAAAAWIPYGTAKLREREQLVARNAAGASSRLARGIADVRTLDPNPRPTCGYPVGAQTVPHGKDGPFLPYVAPRPASAGVFLPPLEGAAPASPTSTSSASAAFGRTAPVSLSLSASSSAGALSSSPVSVLRPVAGVDDPLMRAHVSVSATGNTFAYSSQRLADLAASRHTRHFAALEAYRDGRAALDHQLSAQVESLCEQLRRRCDELEAPIKSLLFERMGSDAALEAMDAAAIEAARGEFEHIYATKSAEIARTVAALEGVEATRAREAAALLEHLVAQWLSIAHLPPADIERTLATESKELNVHLLRNRHTALELGAVLEGELVLKQRDAYTQEWERRYAHWRQLRHAFFRNEFMERFQWDEREPPREEGAEDEEEVQERLYPFQYSRAKRRAFDELSRHGRGFGEWAGDIVLQLLRLTPRSEHEHLLRRVSDLTEQLQQGYLVYDSRTDGLVRRVAVIEGDIQAQAQEMLRKLEHDLLHGAEAKDATQIREEIERDFVPLLRARAEREVAFLRRVEACMKHHDSAFLRAVDQFSSFVVRAAERWEGFQRALRDTDAHFAEELAERRDAFDAQLAGLEAALAESVALLAHEPSRDALETRLKEVRALVGPDGALEEAYRSLYSDALALTQRHPKELQNVLDQHTEAMAAHFGLQTDAELKRQRAALDAAAVAAAAEAAAAEEAADAQLSKRDRAAKDKLRAQAKKDAEKALEKAQEDERKSKLAKVKERAAALAKEEMKALALAKAGGGGDAGAAVSGEESSEDGGALSFRALKAAGGKGSKVSDEALLREIEEAEAATAALQALVHAIDTRARVAFDFTRFHSQFLNDSSIVKLKADVPLSQMGLVEIQPSELDLPPRGPTPEPQEAQTMLSAAEIKECIVQPIKIREAREKEKAAQEAQAAQAAAANSPSKGRPSSRQRRRNGSTAPATVSDTPVESMLPYLSLPPNVLEFHLALDQNALLERILAGESKPRAAGAAGAANADDSAAAAPADAAPAAASGGDATGRSGGELALSLVGGAALETAAEQEEAAAAAAIAEAQAAIAANSVPLSGAGVGSSSPRDGTAASSVPTPEKPGKAKKKSAKELAREEEAARLRAEEERQAQIKAQEEARLAALVAATAVPLDAQGLPTVCPLRFPRALLARLLDLFRENYLLTLQWHGREAISAAQAHNDGLAMDLLKELNLHMRQHRPRFNRIEVDVYERRAKELASNLAAYTRLTSRLNSAYGQAVGQWEETLLRGEREVLLFGRSARECMASLTALGSNPAATLAELHGINTALKQRRQAFSARMGSQVLDKLVRGFAEFQASFQAQIDAFVRAAQDKTFGAHEGGYRFDARNSNKPAGAFIEELDAEGRPVAGSQQAPLECFHADEVAHYASLLSQFSAGMAELVEGEAAKVAALRSRFEQSLLLKDFNACYALTLQNLSIAQGLGHTNGGPKRGLTVGVRSEFHRSKAQESFIAKLIEELEQARRGKLVVGDKAAAAAQEKQRQSEEKDAGSSGEHASTADLAAAFSTLSVSVEAPVAAAAPTLAQHLLHTVDQLRRALLARAQYLAALKPNLPPFVIAPISLTPEQAEADQEAQAEAARVAAMEEEGASLSARSRSRGGKRMASASAVSPDRNGDAAASAAGGTAAAKAKQSAAVGNKRATLSKRSSGDQSSLLPGALSSSNSTDSNRAMFPLFVEVISRHIDAAKRAHHQLVTRYEANHPERKVPLALPPVAPSAEAKEDEGADTRRGSNKKKSARKNKDAAAAPAPAATPSAAEASDTAVPPAIEEHCASELSRSLAHLEEAQKALLAQTDRAASLMAQVGPAVLQDVFARVVEQQLASQLQDIEASFTAKHAQSQAAAARHRATLKPALASRPDASVAALREKEDARWSRSVERIRQFRGDVLRLLQSNGALLSRDLLHASSSLLAACDSLVLPLDLVNVLQDGGSVLGGRANIAQLAMEARRMRLTKEAVAEQAGMALDALGNLVPKDPAAAASGAAAVTSPTGKRAGSASRKKNPAQLEAERAAAEAAQKASAELVAKMDPRWLRISWPGLKLSELELPLPEEERAAQAEAAEKKRAAAAAAAAAAAEAALSPADARKKKRAQAKAAAAAKESGGDAAAAAGEEQQPPSPSASPPGTAHSKARAGSSSGGVSPTRRSKKQREADEAAAAAAATAAEQERQAALDGAQTPAISTLNQPAQRAIVTARNALFARYVALVQQQAAAVLQSSQQMLDAEAKARQEWETQVHLLTNPEPLQF